VPAGDSYCEGSVCNNASNVGMKFMTELEDLKPYLLEYTVSKHIGRNRIIVERKIEKASAIMALLH
jgi:hypothetical protein